MIRGYNTVPGSAHTQNGLNGPLGKINTRGPRVETHGTLQSTVHIYRGCYIHIQRSVLIVECD